MDTRRSGSCPFEPLLTDHAGGGIGNREKAFRRNGGAAFGATRVSAIHRRLARSASRVAVRRASS
jgi:hypothetical protein